MDAVTFIYFKPLYWVLTLAALVVFFYFANEKFKDLKALKDAFRFDQIPTRVGGVLTYMFGQKKILWDPIPGIAHAFIFWGFCVISVESLNFFLGAFTLPFRIPFTSFAFKGIFELFCLMVLLVLPYLYARRLFFKKTRVVRSWGGILILSLILTLIVTGLFLSAEETILGGEANPWKFLSNTYLLPYLVNLSRDTQILIYNLNWWIHGLTFLFFMNYLLRSKHMHVITILFNVFFRSLKPKGRISKLQLEDAEVFGLATYKDLNWKDLLDSYTCTECGRCTEVCPAQISGKHLDPKEIILDLKEHVHQQKMKKKEQTKKPAEETDQAMVDQLHYSNKEDILSCTTCHACQSVCPVENEHVSKIIGYRQNMALMTGEIPQGYQLTFKNLENNSNPWGLASSQRGDRARELNLPLLKDHPEAKVLYFLGCAACFDARAKNIVKSLASLLGKAGISFAVLGDEEFCCGETARRMGNEYLFQEMLKVSLETIKKYKLEEKTIITSDPHCFNSLKNDFSDFGVNLKIEHHSTYLFNLIREGKLSLKKTAPKTITYHDSCYIGRYNDIFSAPREILKEHGFHIKEMRNSGVKSMCCGAGGGRMWLEEDKEHRVNVCRVKQAVDTNAEFVATSCPYCISMFEDGFKTVSKGMPVFDIAEVIESCHADK